MGKVDLNININVSGLPGSGGGEGGRTTPGGGGAVRPEGTSPRGGGNKAAAAAANETRFQRGLAAQEMAFDRREAAASANESRVQRGFAKQEEKARQEQMKRDLREANDRAVYSKLDPNVAKSIASPEGIVDRERDIKLAGRARRISSAATRGDQDRAMIEASRIARSMSPVEAAFDKMTGRLAQLFGSTGDAAQRSAVQGGKISALGKGFIFGGMAHQLAGAAPSQFDALATGAEKSLAIQKGATGAALMGAGFALGGLPGFMIGTALTPIVQGIQDAVAGPDVRKARSAAERNTAELKASAMAGVAMTPERRNRVADLSETAAEMEEGWKQEGVRMHEEAVANRREKMKASEYQQWIDNGSRGSYHDNEAWAAWTIQRAIDRTHPATRDSGLGTASTTP